MSIIQELKALLALERTRKERAMKNTRMCTRKYNKLYKKYTALEKQFETINKSRDSKIYKQ